jgi:hypothetical protein
MILFQQIRFKFIRLTGIIGSILTQTAFAIQIEAPEELEEHVLAYSAAAGAEESKDLILRVSVIKNANCGNAFDMRLINRSSGKTIEQIERCFSHLPNKAMQTGISELFGQQANAKTQIGGGAKTAIIGAAFAAAGILLYYTKPPKPVRVHSDKNLISEESK